MAMPVPEKRIEHFEKLAYGMFIHWGLYSLLGRGEWAMHHENIPKQEYSKLKDEFTAEGFDGRRIAETAKKAGMKYICLTTRHHDGFSLYDTRGLSDYDSVHSPVGRDLILDFVKGCRQNGIVPFFYHTTLDWYQQDFQTNFDMYLEYLRESIKVLCTNYGKVGGFWFDGNWSKPDAEWQEDKLYGVIRKYQPEAIIVNNTGLHQRGLADRSEIDVVTYERGRPEPMSREGMPRYLAAEMCLTMNQHWGVGIKDFNYLSPKELIREICACRKVGANLLLNIGLTAEGKIPDYEKATLLRVGKWFDSYLEILLNGKPSNMKVGSDEDFILEYNQKPCLFVHNLPISGDENVTLGKISKNSVTFTAKDKINHIYWLDNKQSLDFEQDFGTGQIKLKLTGYPYGTDLVVRVAGILM